MDDNEIDLEKAYDKVSWEFIDASLKAAGIPDFLCNVIMSVISGSSIQVLWNWTLTEKFCTIEVFVRGVLCLHSFLSYVGSDLDIISKY